MFTHITYGLNEIIFKGVVQAEVAKEIWNKSAGIHSDPNFIWIQRVPDDLELLAMEGENILTQFSIT